MKEEIQNMEFFYLSGVGKINAAFKSLDLIHRFNPTQIINYGTAGSINKKCQGLIECTKFYQRDMDARGLMNFNLGETPFDDVNEIISLLAIKDVRGIEIVASDPKKEWDQFYSFFNHSIFKKN